MWKWVHDRSYSISRVRQFQSRLTTPQKQPPYTSVSHWVYFRCFWRHEGWFAQPLGKANIGLVLRNTFEKSKVCSYETLSSQNCHRCNIVAAPISAVRLFTMVRNADNWVVEQTLKLQAGTSSQTLPAIELQVLVSYWSRFKLSNGVIRIFFKWPWAVRLTTSNKDIPLIEAHYSTVGYPTTKPQRLFIRQWNRWMIAPLLSSPVPSDCVDASVPAEEARIKILPPKSVL